MASESDILVRTKDCKPVYDGDLAYVVSGDTETSKTWADKSKEYADEAAASAAEAAASAEATAGSVEAAAGYAESAEASAQAAAQSAEGIQEALEAAEAARDTAVASGNTAQTAASAASQSAQSARANAQGAAASATGAAASAQQAAGSASSATQAAARAAGSATDAGVSKTAAEAARDLAMTYARQAQEAGSGSSEDADKARQAATEAALSAVSAAASAEEANGVVATVTEARDEAVAAGADAVAAKNAAVTAKNAAAASAAAADEDRALALAYAQSAERSKNSAGADAVAAMNYKTGAEQARDRAILEAAAAGGQKDLAKRWATSMTVVEDGLYGARKYAVDASEASGEAGEAVQAAQEAQHLAEQARDAASTSAAAAATHEVGAQTAAQGSLTAEEGAVISYEGAVDAQASCEGFADEARLHAIDSRDSADRAEGVVQAHAQDTSLHFSTQDRSDFNHINSLFHQTIPPGTVVAPDDAVPDDWFAGYFARNAQPGDASNPRMMVAPGNVFVSRVPFARKNPDGSWRNTASAMDVTVYDEDTDIRLLDNSGLRHKCSTDKTENVDSYVGKKWAFYWARCNYKRDAYGVKWITAVEGETIGLPNGTTAVFDPKKPTGSFGPSIWTFCCLDTGWGTEEDGTPNFQLWGIGDSPWEALSADRKAWLTAHGVDETKYRPWSTGLWYDGETWKRRSYIVDSAYCGTAEVDANGTLTGISSKYNEPVVNNVSHNIINTKLGNFGGGGVRACSLSIVFDIVKNCTKNSQTIHYGVASNSNNGVVCAANTLNAGYVFPVASKGNFEVGCTVYLLTTTAGASGTSYVRRVTNQIGRIVAIENRDIEVITGDPTVEPVATEVQNKLCLVIDPTTVEPFFARTTTAYATALTDVGTYACAYATQGIALAGETHMVIGKHDGYVSGTNGRHPYRVQGMEMMCGVYQCAADCVVIKGTGSQSVTLPDGTAITPTTSQYVYLYAPSNVVHRQSGTLKQYLDGGYVATGIGTTTAGYIFNGYVDPYWGVWRFTDTGASDHTGHADNSYTGASPAEFLSGGGLNDGSEAGSAFLRLDGGLGGSGWRIGARD